MNKKELRKAFEEGLIKEDQYKEELFKIETAPKDKKIKSRPLPKSLTTEEFKKIISVIPEEDKISKTSFLLAYASGLRISEIVGRSRENGEGIPALTKEKIDPSRGIITIEKAKYGVDRIVPLPKGWKQYIYDLLPVQRSIRTLERNFKYYASKAGLNPKYTFHSLRHGFALRMVESNVPITHVQSLMGHSNVATTSIYARARPQDAIKSYEDLF